MWVLFLQVTDESKCWKWLALFDDAMLIVEQKCSLGGSVLRKSEDFGGMMIIQTEKGVMVYGKNIGWFQTTTAILIKNI